MTNVRGARSAAARGRQETGFVAVELVASVALLMLPTLLLVASLPTWSERRHAATVVAREVARAGAAAWPGPAAGVDTLVGSVATDYDVPPGDFSVALDVDASRGGQAVAQVTVVMPALHVPLIGDAGAWRWSTSYAVRIDDYRSR